MSYNPTRANEEQTEGLDVTDPTSKKGLVLCVRGRGSSQSTLKSTNRMSSKHRSGCGWIDSVPVPELAPAIISAAKPPHAKRQSAT